MGVFSVAPMMGYTDKHFRVLANMVAPSITLYTQMIVADAFVHNKDAASFFGSDKALNNVVLQLGGSNLSSLQVAAKIACQYGYKAINLNIGCPSNKVKLAGAGACLFKTPEIVKNCVEVIKDVADLDVTVKTRVGVDDCDSFQHLVDFVGVVSQSGCNHYIIHARKAWLKGLNPKQNRTVPSLDYDKVMQLKKYYSELSFGMNGGITNYTDALNFGSVYQEVMIGRQAYKDLSMMVRLSQASLVMYPHIEKYLLYVNSNLGQYSKTSMLKHLCCLYYGKANARLWRQKVSQCSAEIISDEELLDFASKMEL